MISTFKEQYKNSIVPALIEQFGYSSVMQVPMLSKIVINFGMGQVHADKKMLERALEELSLIAGQRAVVTRARKSVAGFKIREGWPIGCKVTLRNDRMYQFFERLVRIALPRVRDFRGFSDSSFDSRGNYNLGIQEQIIFLEIDYDKIDVIRGMDISIATTARTDEEGRALIAAFGFPFKNKA